MSVLATFFRDASPGVADLTNWAALIDDGIVIGKDGSLMAGYYYRGPDIASATISGRAYLSSRINAAIAKLGEGWVTWHDAIRLPSKEYPPPENSHFPDVISQLIDAERREQFLAEGQHFETEYVLILMYQPPLTHTRSIMDWVASETPEHREASAERALNTFEKTLDDFEDALGDCLQFRRMKSYTVTDPFMQVHLQDELVNYLHFTLTGIQQPINIPPDGMYMDAYVGGQELISGNTPRIGDKHIACVSIDGYPYESWPNILAVLERLPMAYRWSNRMIYLENHQATNELKQFRRKWRQKTRGFWQQVFRIQGGHINEDAMMMARQAEDALNEASSGLVNFGYYTATVVLMAEDERQLIENARLMVREIQRLGFSARVETLNTMEAWLGSLPGHAVPNIRRPLIHTKQQANLLPLSSVWPGEAHCPCPYFQADAPPLLHASTTGSTPFRLNLHVGDVGHTLVFGPTGSGKSTLLATIAAQFRRYENAAIIAFDKGNSLWPLVNACGGKHYDIGSDTGFSFAPLAAIDSKGDQVWAEEWLATCYELEAGHSPTPKQKQELHRALSLLLEGNDKAGRSLTDFLATVQDQALREAMSRFTISSSLGHLLDAQEDGLHTGSFTVFELEELMAMGDKAAIPVLLYLFRRFEKSLTGQPALLILDEAWIMLGHPVFREKVREWLKVLRKTNCSVVLATQSLSDAVHSGIFDVLLESCPTKILLPNEEADKAGTADHPGPRDLYQMMGLNDTQIDLIKSANRKQHYYYLSPQGCRLFELNLGPIALSFVGASDRETLAHLKDLAMQDGENWPYYWLKERGIDYEQYI